MLPEGAVSGLLEPCKVVLLYLNRVVGLDLFIFCRVTLKVFGKNGALSVDKVFEVFFERLSAALLNGV